MLSRENEPHLLDLILEREGAVRELERERIKPEVKYQPKHRCAGRTAEKGKIPKSPAKPRR